MSAPLALVSLADCKAWLGVVSTTDDAVLTALIAGIAAAVLADLGRAAILPVTVTETVESGDTPWVLLREWPVPAITTCTVDGIALVPSSGSGRAGYVLDPAAPAPPGAPQRLRLSGRRSPTSTVTVSYQAGYAVRGESATVPPVAPFTIQVAAPYGAWACDLGVTGASGAYTVTGGSYAFTAADAGTTVAVSYGYVPADLAQAALEWVADRYASRTRIGQSAKTLGGQETASFVVKAMPDIVSRLLQPYRRVAA